MGEFDLNPLPASFLFSIFLSFHSVFAWCCTTVPLSYGATTSRQYQKKDIFVSTVIYIVMSKGNIYIGIVGGRYLDVCSKSINIPARGHYIAVEPSSLGHPSPAPTFIASELNI